MNRAVWAVIAIITIVFVIFEAVKYGWVAAAVITVFAIAPDVPLIAAFGERGRLRPAHVRPYNLTHSVWLPLALMVASIVLPIPELGLGLRGGFELFLAGLAWFAHIAADRALGYGLRAADGSIRPVGRGAVPTWCTS